MKIRKFLWNEETRDYDLISEKEEMFFSLNLTDINSNNYIVESVSLTELKSSPDLNSLTIRLSRKEVSK
jgi:RNA-binding protein YlmH